MVPHFSHPSCAYATSRAAEGLQKSICMYTYIVSRRPICGDRVQKGQPTETRRGIDTGGRQEAVYHSDVYIHPVRVL